LNAIAQVFVVVVAIRAGMGDFSFLNRDRELASVFDAVIARELDGKTIKAGFGRSSLRGEIFLALARKNVQARRDVSAHFGRIGLAFGEPDNDMLLVGFPYFRSRKEGVAGEGGHHAGLVPVETKLFGVLGRLVIGGGGQGKAPGSAEFWGAEEKNAIGGGVFELYAWGEFRVEGVPVNGAFDGVNQRNFRFEILAVSNVEVFLIV
jgi:hypothetical protein